MIYFLCFLFCVQLSQRLASGLVPIWKLWSYKLWCWLWGCLLLVSRDQSNIITCQQHGSSYTKLAECKVFNSTQMHLKWKKCISCWMPSFSLLFTKMYKINVKYNFKKCQSRPRAFFTQYTHHMQYFSHIVKILIEKKVDGNNIALRLYYF